MLSKFIKPILYSTNIDISNPEEINASPRNHNTTNNNISERNKSFSQNFDNENSNPQKLEKKKTISDIFHFPVLSSDQKYPFNFKNASWTLTIIYITTFILMPIFFSLIKIYGFKITNDNPSENWKLMNLIFQLIIPIIGFFVSLGIDPVRMLRKNGYLAYLNFFVLGLVGFIGGLILTKAETLKQETTNSIILFWIQIFAQFIAAALVICFNRQIRAQLIALLKKAKMHLVVVVICSFAVIQFLNLLINLSTKNLDSTVSLLSQITSGKSDNQKALEAMAKVWYGALALVVGTIFSAPLSEELTCRYGVFSIVRYRWLAYVAAVIYFPSMHVISSGDWSNITGYLAFSLIIPFIFILGRGNIWYTIAIHSASNAFSVILMLTGNNG